MIPENNLFSASVNMISHPSKTYKMYSDDLVFNGVCAELEAVRQGVLKVLSTERYQHLIYSWNYGVELVDLIGKPVSFVCAEVQRRICEALLVDDRIESVGDFCFNTTTKSKVCVSFEVKSIYGDFTAVKEVGF